MRPYWLARGSDSKSWTRTVEPTREPITIQEAKAQARITHDTEDDLLTSYIRAAREEAEEYLGRGLYTQTWVYSDREFPCESEPINLPMAAPLQSVTSVQYYDITGTLQTWSNTNYIVDTASRPGRLTLAPTVWWPATQAYRHQSVTITYVVGWSTVEAIPERIKQGIRLWVGALESDRDGLSPDSARARQAAYACWSDRVEWFKSEAEW